MYIGADIGTGSIKAAVVQNDNFSFHSAAYPSDTERGFEHNIVRVRQALLNLFLEISLVRRAGIDSLKGIAMRGALRTALQPVQKFKGNIPGTC